LILVYPAPAGAPHPLATLVINNSLTDYPANTYRVFNFSKRRLAVNLAETNLLLAPLQSEQVPYPSTRKAWLKVAAAENDGTWLLVNSSPHAVGSDSRTTIFLVDIPPSDRDASPKGIIARRMRERIVTDEKGLQHLR